MNLTITRLDPTLPLPRYETSGAVGFDLYAREGVEIKPRAIVLVPTNLIVKIPPGCMLMVTARSSLPLKKGLMVANGVGIIDQDYCGRDDEIKLQLYNVTTHSVTVLRGERLCQALLIKMVRATFKETRRVQKKSRGGFGSTGFR